MKEWAHDLNKRNNACFEKTSTLNNINENESDCIS